MIAKINKKLQVAKTAAPGKGDSGVQKKFKKHASAAAAATAMAGSSVDKEKDGNDEGEQKRSVQVNQAPINNSEIELEEQLSS